MHIFTLSENVFRSAPSPFAENMSMPQEIENKEFQGNTEISMVAKNRQFGSKLLVLSCEANKKASNFNCLRPTASVAFLVARPKKQLQKFKILRKMWKSSCKLLPKNIYRFFLTFAICYLIYG